MAGARRAGGAHASDNCGCACRAIDPLRWALVALVALPYVPGLWNGFVWLDHEEIVEGMLIVRSWSEVPSLFLDDRNFAGYHRPFYDLLHSLDRAMWGLDPFGFHLSSLVLHGANVALVLALLRWRSRLVRPRSRSRQSGASTP